MRRRKGLFQLFLGITLILSVCFSGTAAAEASQDIQEIQNLVKQYETAAINKDFTAMVNLSKDLRWRDSTRLLKNISNINDQAETFRLISLEKVEDKLYQAIIEQKTKKMPDKQVKVPIIKEDDGWKLILGQDYDSSRSLNSITAYKDTSNSVYKKIKSYDFYKKYFTSVEGHSIIPPIQSLASSVVYYKFSFSYKDSLDSDNWNNNNSTPGISGWQAPNGGHGDWIDIEYSLRTTSFWGSNPIPGASIPVEGMYSQNGTWFAYNYQNIPINDTEMFLRITNHDNSYYVSGAGNVYN